MTQPTMIKSPLACFKLKSSSNIPVSLVAELGPTTDDDIVTDRPFRQAVGGMMWLAGMTRPGIPNAARAVARYSHNPCERHWLAAEKILAYLNAKRDLGITYERGNILSSVVFSDADYASKATDRRSISGVAVMLGDAAVCVTNRTQ